MELGRYIVEAVLLEHRSYRDVALAHGVSKSWVGELVARFAAGGYEALEPRSRRPKASPSQIPQEVEEHIILLRKQLADQGLDAGAQTIHYHLSLLRSDVPSVATIWRVLRRRGFVTPQPQKRPRSSYIRFEASMPNECWQPDSTHWKLAGEIEVEIINIIDDYSRLAVASRAVAVATAPDALKTFHEGAERWGFPASMLSDNGCIFTAAYRGGRSAMESELLTLGILFKHSRPYHPQTCGKVERFHHTMKKHLAKLPPATTIAELQAQIDRFVVYYNEVRPHRAKGRMTPLAAYESRDKARPAGPLIAVGKETRVRRDKINGNGSVSIRYRSRLYHIGIGRALKATRVIVLVSGLHVRVLTEDGEILRELILDPTRDYQPTGRKYSPKGIKLGPRKKKASTMS